MIPLSLAQIARITGGQISADAIGETVVTGEVVIDSRRAGPGGLFAAVAGERVDGHDFASAAVAAGAVAVLATCPVPVPSVLVADVPAALAALASFVLDSLPAIASRVGGRAEVLVEGGIRRGSDVVKALCLGADAVCIGRPYLYGMAAAGPAGAEHVVSILREEIIRCLTLRGVASLSELDESWLLPAGQAITESSPALPGPRRG